jgi:UDP-glucuronate decarboxylase
MNVLQIYGHGNQTRSFQYVSDLVDGLVGLMASNMSKPVNLGNPIERTIKGVLIGKDVALYN